MSNYPDGVSVADIDRLYGGPRRRGAPAEDEWDGPTLTCEHDDAWNAADDAGDEARLKVLEKSEFEGDEVEDLFVSYGGRHAVVQYTCPLCGEKREEEFSMDGEGGWS